jgi:hypothetical protein
MDCGVQKKIMKEPYIYYYPEVTDLASCSSEAWRQKPGEVIGGVHCLPLTAATRVTLGAASRLDCDSDRV